MSLYAQHVADLCLLEMGAEKAPFIGEELESAWSKIYTCMRKLQRERDAYQQELILGNSSAGCQKIGVDPNEVK